MLFSSPFSFFHKTIHGIKSFACGCGCGNYQKLPKHPPLPPLESSHVHQATERTDEIPVPSSSSKVQASRADCRHRETATGGGSGGSKGSCPRSEGGRRSCLVARKLKELEGFDLGNFQHALDIEEAIHYYTLLKCPIYRSIVDEFFTQIYVDILGDSAGDAGH